MISVAKELREAKELRGAKELKSYAELKGSYPPTLKIYKQMGF